MVTLRGRGRAVGVVVGADLIAHRPGRVVDPAGDVSDAYTLVPLPALIEAAAQSYKRDGIAIVFESGPLGENVPATAPIQVV